MDFELDLVAAVGNYTNTDKQLTGPTFQMPPHFFGTAYPTPTCANIHD